MTMLPLAGGSLDDSLGAPYTEAPETDVAPLWCDGVWLDTSANIPWLQDGGDMGWSDFAPDRDDTLVHMADSAKEQPLMAEGICVPGSQGRIPPSAPPNEPAAHSMYRGARMLPSTSPQQNYLHGGASVPANTPQHHAQPSSGRDANVKIEHAPAGSYASGSAKLSAGNGAQATAAVSSATGSDRGRLDQAATAPKAIRRRRNKRGGSRKHIVGDEDEQTENFECPEADCSRTFTSRNALHTHIGWHKRKKCMQEGLYETRDHPNKELLSSTDDSGQSTVTAVYRCPVPGCDKWFTNRGGMYTHQGWHNRQGTQLKKRMCVKAPDSHDPSQEFGSPQAPDHPPFENTTSPFMSTRLDVIRAVGGIGAI